MHKYIKALLLVSVLVVMCSCRVDTSASVLISAEEGKMPCWKTLCIGQGADKTLVMSLLKEIPGTSNIRENIEINEVYFLWEDPANNKIRLGGTVHLYQWQIQTIDIVSDYSVSLGQFMNILGQPSCVEVIDSVKAKAVDLVYYNLGVRIGLKYISNEDYKYLNSKMSSSDIRIFVPSYDKVCPERRTIRVYKWEGFDRLYP